MTSVHVPSWPDFLSSVIKPGGGAYHFRTAPFLAITIDKRSDVCSFIVESSDDDTCQFDSIELKYLKYKVLNIDGRNCLSIILKNQRLIYAFYSLVSDVVFEILREKDSPITCINNIFSQWNRKAALLEEQVTESQKIGLWAELYVLDILLDLYGSKAVRFWGGPYSDVHDFRFNDIEIEVKATRSEIRVHSIHGLTQLCASPDAALFLYSFTLTESEEGSSISSFCESIKKKISDDEVALAMFEEKLYLCRVDSLTDSSRIRKHRLRDDPFLIPVDSSFPSLVPVFFKQEENRNGFGRIRRITYDIDVTGLGTSDRSSIQNLLKPGTKK